MPSFFWLCILGYMTSGSQMVKVKDNHNMADIWVLKFCVNKHWYTNNFYFRTDCFGVLANSETFTLKIGNQFGWIFTFKLFFIIMHKYAKNWASRFSCLFLVQFVVSIHHVQTNKLSADIIRFGAVTTFETIFLNQTFWG